MRERISCQKGKAQELCKGRVIVPYCSCKTCKCDSKHYTKRIMGCEVLLQSNEVKRCRLVVAQFKEELSCCIIFNATVTVKRVDFTMMIIGVMMM